MFSPTIPPQFLVTMLSQRLFYPLLLMVSHKFGIYHNPIIRISGTRGSIIFIQLLCSTVFHSLFAIYEITSGLALIKQFVDSYKSVSIISCKYHLSIKVKNFAPFSKCSCGFSDSYIDISFSVPALSFHISPSAI